MRLQMIQVGTTTAKKIYEMMVIGKVEPSIMVKFAEESKKGLIDKLKTQKFILNVVTKEHKGEVKSNAEVEYEEFPSAEDLSSSLSEVLAEVKESRKQQRELIQTPRTALGGTTRYNLVAGVHMEPDTINTVIGVNIRMGRVGEAKVPKTNDKYVGVELEIACKLNNDALKREFAAARLHNHVNVGTDSSIRPERGGQGHEVRVLMREDEVKAIMTRVCAVLNSDKVQAYVNDSCGVHVHLDMRNRDAAASYKGLVRGLPLLNSMVPQCRKSSTYCVANDSDKFESKGGKYWAINPNSYQERRTIETRLHSGSTNAKKIINWISVLLTLANKVPTSKIATLEDFKAFTDNSMPDLYTYMQYRIAKFKTMGHMLSTETDDVTDFMQELNQAAV